MGIFILIDECHGKGKSKKDMDGRNKDRYEVAKLRQ